MDRQRRLLNQLGRVWAQRAPGPARAYPQGWTDALGVSEFARQSAIHETHCADELVERLGLLALMSHGSHSDRQAGRVRCVVLNSYRLGSISYDIPGCSGRSPDRAVRVG